jgi:hypothetical protein
MFEVWKLKHAGSVGSAEPSSVTMRPSEGDWLLYEGKTSRQDVGAQKVVRHRGFHICHTIDAVGLTRRQPRVMSGTQIWSMLSRPQIRCHVARIMSTERSSDLRGNGSHGCSAGGSVVIIGSKW